MKNKLEKCKDCGLVWQTHECEEVSLNCPKCGSIKKDLYLEKNKDRIFSSHLISTDDYDSLIFGSKNGRTWHDEFGHLKFKK